MRKLSLRLRVGDFTQFIAPNGVRVAGVVTEVEGSCVTLKDDHGGFHVLEYTKNGWLHERRSA